MKDHTYSPERNDVIETTEMMVSTSLVTALFFWSTYVNLEVKFTTYIGTDG